MSHPHIDEKISTKAEHITPPIITYLFRKVLLYSLVVNLKLIRQLAKVYGFNFEAEVGDRESWKWELKKKVPLYRPFFEKVN